MQPKMPQQPEPGSPLVEDSKSVRPKLTSIQVSNEEIKEWAELPVTRIWFKSLLEEIAKYEEVCAKAYRRGDANASYGILAEATGAIEALNRLLNAEDMGMMIFSKEDREENIHG